MALSKLIYLLFKSLILIRPIMDEFVYYSRCARFINIIILNFHVELRVRLERFTPTGFALKACRYRIIRQFISLFRKCGN